MMSHTARVNQIKIEPGKDMLSFGSHQLDNGAVRGVKLGGTGLVGMPDVPILDRITSRRFQDSDTEPSWLGRYLLAISAGYSRSSCRQSLQSDGPVCGVPPSSPPLSAYPILGVIQDNSPDILIARDKLSCGGRAGDSESGRTDVGTAKHRTQDKEAERPKKQRPGTIKSTKGLKSL
ncbi:hypothetical protein RRG08_021776 [Elysia crispata]|uniref:Uncharacterized protein n=1 Tax=Elysia crispata TaxID=231223 RepID=A0AAE0ZY28_9GAST|nr:hypothetical protein RRG08_021776 [Elysia crispata]